VLQFEERAQARNKSKSAAGSRTIAGAISGNVAAAAGGKNVDHGALLLLSARSVEA